MARSVGSAKELLAAKGKHIDIYVSCDCGEAMDVLTRNGTYYFPDPELPEHPDRSFVENHLDSHPWEDSLDLRHMNGLFLDGISLTLEEMASASQVAGFPTQTILRLYTGMTNGGEGVIEELRVKFKERRQNIAFVDEKHTMAYVCLDPWYGLRAGIDSNEL